MREAIIVGKKKLKKGAKGEAKLDVLDIGPLSEIRKMLPQARRMHTKYSEILFYESPTIRERTRSDLPPIPGLEIPEYEESDDQDMNLDNNPGLPAGDGSPKE